MIAQLNTKVWVQLVWDVYWNQIGDSDDPRNLQGLFDRYQIGTSTFAESAILAIESLLKVNDKLENEKLDLSGNIAKLENTIKVLEETIKDLKQAPFKWTGKIVGQIKLMRERVLRGEDAEAVFYELFSESAMEIPEGNTADPEEALTEVRKLKEILSLCDQKCSSGDHHCKLREWALAVSEAIGRPDLQGKSSEVWAQAVKDIKGPVGETNTKLRKGINDFIPSMYTPDTHVCRWCGVYPDKAHKDECPAGTFLKTVYS